MEEFEPEDEPKSGCTLTDLANYVRRLDRRILIAMRYIHNDDKTGSKGLFQRTTDLEEAFEKLVNKLDIETAEKKGKQFVYAYIGATVATIVVFLIKALFPFLLKYASKFI